MLISKVYQRRKDIPEVMELLGNSQKTNSCTHTKARKVRKVFLLIETRKNASGYYIL